MTAIDVVMVGLMIWLAVRTLKTLAAIGRAAEVRKAVKIRLTTEAVVKVRMEGDIADMDRVVDDSAAECGVEVVGTGFDVRTGWRMYRVTGAGLREFSGRMKAAAVAGDAELSIVMVTEQKQERGG